ncbi:hypothetical protein KIN20_019102 [Parelaphostrongylus tenuis]|uniref:Uncharacterized protein n=1 Tax=Parelaphostrongylus tenuis TaxID=148309 RepID=A0AAD5N2R5_PARTN|nr:hypothetical protein KIN20_019102 [Parelaphostrongylus tenuis]
MKAKVEQQRLAKQLAQPPSEYTSTLKCAAAAPPSSSSHARLETSTTNVSFYAPVKVENEAEEVVPSTTASVDTPRNIALRPLAPRPSAPRPSCSQNSHDFVVGQIALVCTCLAFGALEEFSPAIFWEHLLQRPCSSDFFRMLQFVVG